MLRDRHAHKTSPLLVMAPFPMIMIRCGRLLNLLPAKVLLMRHHLQALWTIRKTWHRK